MQKLGLTFQLGVHLGFAAFQASIKDTTEVTNSLIKARSVVDQLNQNHVTLDPTRLQDAIDFGAIRQDIIESFRDHQFADALAAINSVLFNAYKLGVAISGAEGLSGTNQEGVRPIIGDNLTAAMSFAQTLIDGTPKVPLDLANLSSDLSIIDTATMNFNVLHTLFVFVRGKCEGVLYVSPDPI
jgi:hypothetical protein